MFKAKVIKVIETDLLGRGKGTPENPVRRIHQIYSLDGELIMEHDPVNRITPEQQSCKGCKRENKPDHPDCSSCARAWTDRFLEK